ncbi:MAG TPA: glycosyltransferase family 4 protein [Gaiellales bacterium]|nr:glycosyltransferase family 4 protein [Gaiellales bacterium]
MTQLHLVVPADIHDPRRPSGGNRYDRRVCEQLAASGWTVMLHATPGDWPHAAGDACAALAAVLDAIPNGSLVIVDGLIASAADTVLLPRAGRLRLVVLVHMPLGQDGDPESRRREGAVLASAGAVVVTSEWSRTLLTELYDLPAGRMHVALPGVDVAPAVGGTETGGELLCVSTVTRAKGYDVLVEALASIAALGWSSTCVGSLDRDPGFTAATRAAVDDAGLSGRVRFAGACSDAELEELFRSADVLVHPSRSETYGMAVAEALAHGLPVIASDVGGVPEAIGSSPSGPPGLLVPPGDVSALARALRSWLGDADLRRRLRAAAGERRSTLPSWSHTAAALARACEAAPP